MHRPHCDSSSEDTIRELTDLHLLNYGPVCGPTLNVISGLRAESCPFKVSCSYGRILYSEVRSVVEPYCQIAEKGGNHSNAGSVSIFYFPIGSPILGLDLVYPSSAIYQVSMVCFLTVEDVYVLWRLSISIQP